MNNTIKVNYTETLNNYPMPRKLFRKRKYTTKEIVCFSFMYIVPCILLVWFLFSWMNTVSNNLTTFDYAWWNMFRLFGLR